jgi:hypothetical protein
MDRHWQLKVSERKCPYGEKNWPVGHPSYRLPSLRGANVQVIFSWTAILFSTVAVDAIYLVSKTVWTVR